MDEEVATEQAAETPNRSHGPDPLLKVLARGMENNPTQKIGVTVTVAGGVLTGSLVGFDAWIGALRQHEALGPYLDGFQDGMDAADEKFAEGANPGRGDFVHLIEARFFAGDAMVPSRASQEWRIRFDQISGWAFGSLA